MQSSDHFNLKCPFDNQAQKVCGNKPCTHPPLMCENSSCQCHTSHNTCFLTATLVSLRHAMELKMKNYNPVCEQLVKWYDVKIKQYAVEREELKEKMGKIMLSLTEAQTSLYQYMRRGESDNITPELVSFVSEELYASPDGYTQQTLLQLQDKISELNKVTVLYLQEFKSFLQRKYQNHGFYKHIQKKSDMINHFGDFFDEFPDAKQQTMEVQNNTLTKNISNGEGTNILSTVSTSLTKDNLGDLSHKIFNGRDFRIRKFRFRVNRIKEGEEKDIMLGVILDGSKNSYFQIRNGKNELAYFVSNGGWTFSPFSKTVNNVKTEFVFNQGDVVEMTANSVKHKISFLNETTNATLSLDIDPKGQNLLDMGVLIYSKDSQVEYLGESTPSQ